MPLENAPAQKLVTEYGNHQRERLRVAEGFREKLKAEIVAFAKTVKSGAKSAQRFDRELNDEGVVVDNSGTVLELDVDYMIEPLDEYIDDLKDTIVELPELMQYAKDADEEEDEDEDDEDYDEEEDPEEEEEE